MNQLLVPRTVLGRYSIGGQPKANESGVDGNTEAWYKVQLSAFPGHLEISGISWHAIITPVFALLVSCY